MVLIGVNGNDRKFTFFDSGCQRRRGPAPEPPRFSWHNAGISNDLLFRPRSDKMTHAGLNATSSAETQLARDSSVAGVSNDTSST